VAVEWKKNNGQDVVIVKASVNDAQTILSLQKRAYIQEAEINDGNYDIPPLLQTLDEMKREFPEYVVLKALREGRIVGSVRARRIGSICHIGRLVVEPICQKNGIGTELLLSIQRKFPDVTSFELFTGAKSATNIRFYKKMGFAEENAFDGPNGLKLIMMRKQNR
jgi:N-acetylglutamate synthase-like GNAT family acetyltransferase